MLQDLDSVLETEFDGGALQNAFAQTESKVGRHLLDQQGFTANLEVLQLKSDIEKAVQNSSPLDSFLRSNA